MAKLKASPYRRPAAYTNKQLVDGVGALQAVFMAATGWYADSLMILNSKVVCDTVLADAGVKKLLDDRPISNRDREVQGNKLEALLRSCVDFGNGRPRYDRAVATIERMWPHAACRINSNYDPGKSMTYYWVEFGKIKAIYMQPPGESDVVKPYGLNELRARLTREYWILGNAVCWYVDGEFCFKDKTIAVNMQTAEPVNQKGCGVNAIPAKDTASFSKFLDGLKDHGNQEPEYDRVVATIKRSHPNAYCRYAGVRMDEADLDFIGHRYYWIDKGDIVAVYLTTNKHE